MGVCALSSAESGWGGNSWVVRNRGGLKNRGCRGEGAACGRLGMGEELALGGGLGSRGLVQVERRSSALEMSALCSSCWQVEVTKDVLPLQIGAPPPPRARDP